jgi:hypothetical protein
MTSISFDINPKVGGCAIGNMVHDHALGKIGLVVGSAYTEVGNGTSFAAGEITTWEWAVLYEDGEVMGADTNDLQVMR